MDSLFETTAQSNLQGIEFLQRELELANTFLDVAETFSQPTHKEQSHRDAVAAYRSVLHFLPRLHLTTSETAEFEERIERLHVRLLAAGIEL